MLAWSGEAEPRYMRDEVVKWGAVTREREEAGQQHVCDI